MRLRTATLFALAVGLLTGAPVAQADPSDYAGPLFGVTTGARPGALLVADSGQGIVRLRDGNARLIVELPGVTDVALRAGGLWATVSASRMALYGVRNGRPHLVADLGAFEARHNPHPDHVESNPFDVVSLPRGGAAVADAAGNDLLRVRPNGDVDVIAIFPNELVPTANAKRLVGCPDPDDPALEEICQLPRRIPAEAVPAGLARGPDGALYVGELKGFPAPLGQSRIWRIEPGARHARCGTSPKCRVVVDGLTSIIDLQFRRGRLYVAQIDDASWYALEVAEGANAVGGSVHRCDPRTGDCDRLRSHVPVLTAIALRRNGSLWGTVNAIIPGEADVVRLLPPE